MASCAGALAVADENSCLFLPAACLKRFWQCWHADLLFFFRASDWSMLFWFLIFGALGFPISCVFFVPFNVFLIQKCLRVFVWLQALVCDYRIHISLMMRACAGDILHQMSSTPFWKDSMSPPAFSRCIPSTPCAHPQNSTQNHCFVINDAEDFSALDAQK